MRTIHLLPKYQKEFLKNLDGRFSCNSPISRVLVLLINNYSAHN